MTPFSQSVYLCVIGGGINGAGIAFDATRRGLSVALYERHDFGCGASTATSKLAHGGLRYLEQWQFRLVNESLRERNVLLKLAPHVVKPCRFYVPLYRHATWRAWTLRIGLTLYDWMQASALPRHTMLSSKELLSDVPWLTQTDCVGGASYYDAQMSDHRLIMELLRMAHRDGAAIHNRATVQATTPFDQGVSLDVAWPTGQVSSIRAHSVIAATGAWSNQWGDLVSPSKGVHIVLPNMGLSMALLLMTPLDHRVFFMIPWEGHTLVGTTDQSDDQDYSHPSVSSKEVQYLLDAVNAYHTQRVWCMDDVVGAFCGYRPLVSSCDQSPSNQSRESAWTWVSPNMLVVSGGKYTTYRAMSETAVNMVQQQVFSNRVLSQAHTNTQPFMGSRFEWPGSSQQRQLCQAYHMDEPALLHLISTYGAIYKDMLQMVVDNPDYAKRIHPDYPMVVVELAYAIQYEWAQSLTDILFRRTHYGYVANHSLIRAMAMAYQALTQDNHDVDTLVQQVMQESMW